MTAFQSIIPSVVRRVALAVLCATVCCNVCAAPQEPRPNIVLIVADDLGIYDLACYGRKEHATPRLDRLASQGARFTCAYCAQPICSASRAALLTGLSPARLHLTTFLPGRADCPAQKLLHPQIQPQLPVAEVTLAERFQAAGYTTGCFGKWHLGGPGFGPLEQGFDEFVPGQPVTVPSASEGGKGEYELTDRALDFIDRHCESPFLLYVPYDSPHVPLAARAALVEKHRQAFNPIYAAMLESLDECVGRIIDRLETRQLAENTLLIFTSDNGGLHVPELPHTPATTNEPFRAGKGFLYEGGLRIPLLVRWPGKIPPATVDAPVVNTDWLPTLLELCRLPPAERQDGVSLAPLLLGQAEEPPQRDLFWHFPHYTNQGGRPAGAMRSGRWKYIEHYEDGRGELFDLQSDPGEARDLAAEQADRLGFMRDHLAQWVKEVDGQRNTFNPDFDRLQWLPLYADVDVSRLTAEKTAEATARKLGEWRVQMDQAVRPAKGR